MPAVVEAEPVDQRAILDQTKHARARIAGLRQRCHRADLGEPEPDAEHGVGHARILVEACSNAERVGEFHSPHAQRESRIVRDGRTRIDAGFQRFQRQLVRHLRLEREQQRPGKIECGCKHLYVL
jgi:hypothetical protein